MKSVKLLFLAITTLCVNVCFAQLNRVINSDTIFYHNGNWNSKIDTFMIPLDTSSVIIKFNTSYSKQQVIDYLQLKNLVLIDSLDDYFLCETNLSLNYLRNVDTLESSTYIESVELNYSGFLDTDPNDTYFSSQEYLNDGDLTIKQTYAWTRTYGNPNVIVAVIDEFPDWGHEDIGLGTDGYDNIWKNPKEDAWSNPNNPTSGNGIDDDGNGLIDDWKGWDIRYNDNDTRPGTGQGTHGTNVTGVIAAKTNNNKGISGIAGGNNSSGVRIMSINIIKANTNIYDAQFKIFDLAKAVNYAAQHDANIIALSLSTGKARIGILEYIFNKATHDYGVIVFCSAGNTDRSTLNYPAAYESVYSVGAMNAAGTTSTQCKGDYQNGLILDFVATEFGVFTTEKGNQYSTFGGTSSTSPQVSGVAALILSKYPCISNTFVYQIMKESATREYFPDYENKFTFDNNTNSNDFGYGVPNAMEALNLIESNYLVTDHTISVNTEWNSMRVAIDDITVESGATLTITSDLYMSENNKIIVEPGGNLVVAGGKITNNCGWGGIEVYGLPNVEQNSSTFGEVILYYGAIIENAKIGVHSINGGILKTSDESKFRNNYQSIVIEKYSGVHSETQI